MAGVEGGIEAGDLWEFGPQPAQHIYGLDRPRVVEGRQVGQRPESFFKCRPCPICDAGPSRADA